MALSNNRAAVLEDSLAMEVTAQEEYCTIIVDQGAMAQSAGLTLGAAYNQIDLKRLLV